jgi:multidrug resistance protein, MATE family
MRLLSAFTSDTDKALWRLALPMIFSNITVPLLGLVDTAVIGHLDSPVYLGGVAVGAMATSFLFMLLLFLRMSTTGLTAQALGAQTHRDWRAPLCNRCCWRRWPVWPLSCCAIR